MEGGDQPAELSKNALKKQLKAQQKEAEKAAKEAEKAAKKAAAPTKSSDDEELDPTQYYENRIKAMSALEETGVSPYPHKFHASHRLGEFIAEFSTIADGDHDESKIVSVTGRVLSKRGQGKLMFYDLHGESKNIIFGKIDNSPFLDFPGNP